MQQSAFPDSPADADRLAAFKHATAAKLRTAVCPVHGRLPVLRFQGASIRDVTINVSGCCDVLLSIANRAVANR